MIISRQKYFFSFRQEPNILNVRFRRSELSQAPDCRGLFEWDGVGVLVGGVQIKIMKMNRRDLSRKRTPRAVCTVSAAALMLGVSHAATIGFNFQTHYCSAASYSGAPVTAPAFGIDPSGWENLSQMDTGYGCDSQGPFALSEDINTSTADDGLNPLPRGALTINWNGSSANVSGFGGYDRGPAHPGFEYGGNSYRPGEEQVYWGFIRDGVNFGPLPDQGGYSIDVAGLKTVFTNSPFVVQLIASSDSAWSMTNAFVIDATATVTNSVSYENFAPIRDQHNASFPRGIGGGISTASAPLNTDHLKIVGNTASHGDDFNYASTISGFIVTDKPVVTMSPQPVLASNGDDVTLRAIAIGVPPVSLQWRKAGVAIAGATNAAYSLSKITNIVQGGNYDLVATNLYGTATSKVSVVTVDKLVITAQPFVVDSKPSGTKVDGLNLGATWVASNSDGEGTNRQGVMQFSSSQLSQIVIPVGTNTDFDSTSGTMSFWMRSSGTNTTVGNEGAMILDRRTGSGLVVVQHDDGTLFLQTAPASVDSFSSTASVSDGRWHNVTIVYEQADGGGIAIYIDGRLDSSGSNTGNWSWPAGQQIELGRSHDSYWRAYNGLLDDVRLYNRELSDTEIASLASTGALVDETALVERLNFDTAPINGISVSWQSGDAVLQSATTVNGPYTDVTNVSSPLAVEIPASGNTFYRYRHTPASILSNPYDM